MNILVTFQTRSTATTAQLNSFLQSYKEWAFLTDASCLIATEASTASVIESLYRYMEPGDQAWAFEVSGDWSGYGDVIVEDYVTRTLGPEMEWLTSDRRK